MRKDKDGNRLFRKVTVKVVFPDNIFPDRTFVQHAGAKQGFGPDGIFQMLDQIATQLDDLYPWWSFESVELAPIAATSRHVFKFAGYNAPKINPMTDGNTPASETTEDLTLPAIQEAVGTTLQELSSQIEGPEAANEA